MVSLAHALSLSGALRLLLVIWGEVQDRYLQVKYTDIDYQVFTDAARHVTEGSSPYSRSTYRYSPLLAYLLIPNITIHYAWGKILFSCCDLLVAWLITCILTKQGYSRAGVLTAVISWLFNPWTFSISTRGSCDVLAALILLSTIYLLLIPTRSRLAMLTAAFLYGLVVHLRVYPIIYAPSLILFLTHQSIKRFGSKSVSSTTRLVVTIINCLTFGLVSALTFCLLVLIFYKSYGWIFVQEAFLHHLTRKDHRHSFSPHFYPIYLSYGQREAIGSTFIPDVSLGSSLIQLSLQAYLSLHLHHDLPLCLLVQTMSFVALNKVVTAQYFVWWFSLLPLCIPRLKWPLSRSTIKAISFWVATQLHWLFWGYQLEFRGQPVHLIIWASGLAFMVANAVLIIEVLKLTETRG